LGILSSVDVAFSVTFHCWNSALLYAVAFVVVFVDVGVVNVVVGVVLFLLL
jgi:hypothetical protein